MEHLGALMPMHQDEPCNRCRGLGIIRIKNVPTQVLCSCNVGRMIARDVQVFARPVRVAHG